MGTYRNLLDHFSVALRTDRSSNVGYVVIRIMKTFYLKIVYKDSCALFLLTYMVRNTSC